MPDNGEADNLVPVERLTIRYVKREPCPRCEGAGWTRSGEDCVICGLTGVVETDVTVGIERLRAALEQIADTPRHPRDEAPSYVRIAREALGLPPYRPEPL